jgi:hypothetical protein
MNFEIDLRGIQSMFDQGLYNKIKADTMDNNFYVVALAVCHIIFQEKRPSMCPVRRSEENLDGTVFENISSAEHLTVGIDRHCDSRHVLDRCSSARRASLRPDIYGLDKIAVVARECPDRHAATGPCNRN